MPANTCRTGVVSCSTGSSVCQERAAVPDGTPCGANTVCSAGQCVDRATTRTISATFQTIYIRDDESRTIVDEPPPGDAIVKALLSPSPATQGYAVFPVAVGADGHFEVSGVPVGQWFLQLERPTQALSRRHLPPSSQVVPAVALQLIPISTGTPDLTTVLAARPDLSRARNPTPVTATFSNLEPWSPDSRLYITSAQGDLFLWLYSMRPPAGTTFISHQFDWLGMSFGPRAPGLPDPTKGDSVFFYQQQLATSVANGTILRAVRYGRLDSLEVVDGHAATVSVPLVEAPQTGNVDIVLKTTDFAVLSTDVNPTAVINGVSFSISAVPHAAQYPEQPVASRRNLFSFSKRTTSDVSLVSTYGQFLGQPWQETRLSGWLFSGEYSDEISTYVWIDDPAQIHVVTPVLGPPTQPRINGEDAFPSRLDVGLEPMLSWSPPRLGLPSSYQVTVQMLSYSVHSGDTVSLSAVVDGTSFKIPPGFLHRERSYIALITSRQAPWDGPTRLPLRTGVPLYTADCVTGSFEP